MTGVLILPALLLEWHNRKKKSILHSPILYIAPLGLLAYMIFLQVNFRDALYFWHAQPVFGAERSSGSIIFFPQVVWRYIKMFASVSYKTETFWITFSELIFTLATITMLIIGHIRKIRLSYLVFSWLILLLPTFTGTFSSMSRYVLSAFPIYICLGLISNKYLKIILMILFVILLSLYSILFTRGHWVA